MADDTLHPSQKPSPHSVSAAPAATSSFLGRSFAALRMTDLSRLPSRKFSPRTLKKLGKSPYSDSCLALCITSSCRCASRHARRYRELAEPAGLAVAHLV